MRSTREMARDLATWPARQCGPRFEAVDIILAGVRSPRRGRKPATWTRIDRDYEALCINMQTLFQDLGIATEIAAATA